jgi:hypothetical protein
MPAHDGRERWMSACSLLLVALLGILYKVK